VNAAAGFVEQGAAVPLKFMPLEKPGGFMAVPETPLQPGFYTLDFLGRRHRFGIGMASVEDTGGLAAKAQDRVLVTRLAGSGGGFGFGNGQDTTLKDSTRAPELTDQEAATSLQTALDSWKSKNYREAIPAAILALGYHPQEQTLQEIVSQGTLTAARETLKAGQYELARRWAEEAMEQPAQREEATKLLREALLLPVLSGADAALQKKDFDAARRALQSASYDLREDPRIQGKEREVKMAESNSRLEAAIEARQWDTALKVVDEAVEAGLLHDAPYLAGLKRIRQGAAADSRYYGVLHLPVWEVKLGSGDVTVQGLRKAPGADVLVAWFTPQTNRDTSFFHAVKASTGRRSGRRRCPGRYPSGGARTGACSFWERRRKATPARRPAWCMISRRARCWKAPAAPGPHAMRCRWPCTAGEACLPWRSAAGSWRWTSST
jgi:tetratricopeptide (TPR) repeat protein